MKIVSKGKYKEINDREYKEATGISLTAMTLLCFLIGGPIALIGLNNELSSVIGIGMVIMVGGPIIVLLVKSLRDTKKIKLLVEKFLLSHEYKDLYEYELRKLSEEINKELNFSLSAKQILETERVVFSYLNKKNIPVYKGMRFF